MTKGSIQGREGFLKAISSKLGRPERSTIEKSDWRFKPQWEVFKDQSQDELLELFIQACERQGTSVLQTHTTALSDTLSNMIKTFGGGSLVASNDQRFDALNLRSSLENQDVFFWNSTEGDRNIELAKKANIGIAFSDQALAESGTTVFYHTSQNARSITLLPKNSIIILSKSSIVPRLTQATKKIHDRVKSGEAIESYINMVSGPSNSADIEMNMVVGVHGPVKVGYIILEDD